MSMVFDCKKRGVGLLAVQVIKSAFNSDPDTLLPRTDVDGRGINSGVMIKHRIRTLMSDPNCLERNEILKEMGIPINASWLEVLESPLMRSASKESWDELRVWRRKRTRFSRGSSTPHGTVP